MLADNIKKSDDVLGMTGLVFDQFHNMTELKLAYESFLIKLEFRLRQGSMDAATAIEYADRIREVLSTVPAVYDIHRDDC